MGFTSSKNRETLDCLAGVPQLFIRVRQLRQHLHRGQAQVSRRFTCDATRRSMGAISRKETTRGCKYATVCCDKSPGGRSVGRAGGAFTISAIRFTTSRPYGGVRPGNVQPRFVYVVRRSVISQRRRISPQTDDCRPCCSSAIAALTFRGAGEPTGIISTEIFFVSETFAPTHSRPRPSILPPPSAPTHPTANRP